MLTTSHRQESLGFAYVQAVAAQAGLICCKPDLDYGIDLSLRFVDRTEDRYRDSGVQLDIQLKSTTKVIFKEKMLKYDLRVKAYDDLRKEDIACPRILVLFVLPVDELQWIHQTTEELILRRCAYWLSLKGDPPTEAASASRISIPLANVFSVEAVTAILERIKEGKSL